MYAFHVSGAPRLPGKRRLLSSASIAAIMTFAGGAAMAQQAPEQPPQAAPQQQPGASNLPPVVVEKPAERPAEGKPQKEGNAERRAKKKPENAAKQPAAAAQQNTGGAAKDPTAYTVSNATTATKTDTPIMVTPANIQVVPQQVLQDQQVITLDQALQNVSGVNVSGGGSANNGAPYSSIAIRGFATDAYFIDGTRLDSYATSSAIYTQGLANVDHIEVLKGPAAILYGLVEPGGIVNIVTKAPQATPSYSIQQDIGSYNLSRTTFNATGPLTQNGDVLYRLDTSFLNQGSQVDFVYNRNFFIAPTVQWNIDQANTLRADFSYRASNFGANFGFIPTSLTGASPLGSIINFNPALNYGATSPNQEKDYLAALTFTHKFNSDWQIKDRVLFQSSTVHASQFDDPFFIAQSGTQQLLDGNNLIVPQTASGFAVARGIFNVQSTNMNFNDTLDLTGHFNTFGLAHTLLIGGDYSRFSAAFSNSAACINFTSTETNCSFVDLLNPVNPGTPYSAPPSPFAASKQLTETAGFYVQDQLKLPWNIYLLGGGRLQYIHQNYEISVPAFGLPLSSTEIEETAITPRGGALWQVTDWLAPYVSYTESFGPNAPGQLGAATAPGKQVPPTSGQQFEYGAKFSFLGDKLVATFSRYNLQKTNIPVADPNGDGFFTLIGLVKVKGEDFDLQGALTPQWKAILNYAHTEGGQLVGAAVDTFHLWTSYEFESDYLKGWKIGGGVTYSSGPGIINSAQLPNISPAATAPEYFTADLFTAYKFDAGGRQVTLQLNATNIFDRRYLSQVYTEGPYALAPNFGSISGVYGAPRTIVGSVKVQF
jgi:iron complex outermembrane receptor protein